MTRTSGKRSPSGRNKGLALVSVMLIVAIVVSITAYMAYQQQLWLRQVENISLRAQSESVRYSMGEWIGILLRRDAENSGSDNLTEEWAHEYPALPVENGLVAASILDSQGRFNLNNLVKDNGDPSPGDIDVFRRLLQSQDLDPNLADAALDWLDKNPNRSAHGAEDLYYMNLGLPYRSANHRFVSIDELRLVRGFDHKSVNKLREHVAALPQRTSLNVNTVTAPVFAAMFPELRSDFIDELVELRKNDPFDKKTDLARHLPAGQPLPTVAYDVKTEFFKVRIQTRFGHLQRDSDMLLYRPSKGKNAKVVWQSQVPLILLPEEKDGDVE